MLFRSLKNELLFRKDRNLDPRTQSLLAAELRLAAVAKKVFENSEVQISCNENLFDLFECDIILRIPKSKSKLNENFEIENKEIGNKEIENKENQFIIMNIEIDGIKHLREKKKRFCKLRDKYLTSEGIVIERVEASFLRKLKLIELEEWLSAKIAEVIKECK